MWLLRPDEWQLDFFLKVFFLYCLKLRNLRAKILGPLLKTNTSLPNIFLKGWHTVNGHNIKPALIWNDCILRKWYNSIQLFVKCLYSKIINDAAWCDVMLTNDKRSYYYYNTSWSLLFLSSHSNLPKMTFFVFMKEWHAVFLMLANEHKTSCYIMAAINKHLLAGLYFSPTSWS